MVRSLANRIATAKAQLLAASVAMHASSSSDAKYDYDDDAAEDRHPDDVAILREWFRKGMLSASAKQMIAHCVELLRGGWSTRDILGWISIEHKWIQVYGGMQGRILEKAKAWAAMEANKDPDPDNATKWCPWHTFQQQVEQEMRVIGMKPRQATRAEINYLRKWLQRGFLDVRYQTKLMKHMWDSAGLDANFWDIERIKMWLEVEQRTIKFHGGLEWKVLQAAQAAHEQVKRKYISTIDDERWFPWDETLERYNLLGDVDDVDLHPEPSTTFQGRVKNETPATTAAQRKTQAATPAAVARAQQTVLVREEQTQQTKPQLQVNTRAEATASTSTAATQSSLPASSDIHLPTPVTSCSRNTVPFNPEPQNTVNVPNSLSHTQQRPVPYAPPQPPLPSHSPLIPFHAATEPQAPTIQLQPASLNQQVQQTIQPQAPAIPALPVLNSSCTVHPASQVPEPSSSSASTTTGTQSNERIRSSKNTRKIVRKHPGQIRINVKLNIKSLNIKQCILHPGSARTMKKMIAGIAAKKKCKSKDKGREEIVNTDPEGVEATEPI